MDLLFLNWFIGGSIPPLSTNNNYQSETNMEKKNYTHGYKGMLRDRMLPFVSLALKRCKCKDKYIDYVYQRFVRNKPVEQRSLAVKQVLGLKAAVSFDEIQLWAWQHGKSITRKQLRQTPNELRFFNFEDTIDWETLKQYNRDSYLVFKVANTWVKWFKVNLSYLENIWDINKNTLHRTDAQVSAEFKQRFKLDDESIKFIIKYLKNGK